MSKPTSAVLGIDASTQSMSGVLMDADSGQILWSNSLAYRDDPRLLGFGFEHDSLLIPPREPGEAEQPPRLFIAALDALLTDLRASGADMASIAAINVSGQQHGHVYLNSTAAAAFAGLQRADASKKPLLDHLSGSLAYGGAPIWKTANTKVEADHIRQVAGGQAAIIRLSGSDIPLRFSACAHRKVAIRYPEAWVATAHILQISAFIPAILVGNPAIGADFGNACGTGLMNYTSKTWDSNLLAATTGDLPGGAAALSAKLPPLVHPLTVVGKVAAWFQEKFGLGPQCQIIAGSGDNPQSKVLAPGDLLSLGTSFVYMIDSPSGGIDVNGTANAMYDGLGRPFNFGCRTNGALAWDRLRTRHGQALKDFAGAERALESVPVGSVLRFWHPDSESFPLINANPEPVRNDDGPIDFAHDYAGVVDSALGLLQIYGQKIAMSGSQNKQSQVETAPFSVCGGPTGSPAIMQRIAAIWNRPAIQIGQAGAALGAALSAACAIVPESQRQAKAEALRNQIFAGKPVTTPNPKMVQAYHGPTGYLARLEKAFENLRKS